MVIHNFAGVVDTGNASFAGINDTGDACIAGVVYTGDTPSELREFASVFKGTISKKTIYQQILLPNSVHSILKRVIQLQ